MIKLIVGGKNSARMADALYCNSQTSPWFIVGRQGDHCFTARTYATELFIPVYGFDPDFKQNHPSRLVLSCPQISHCKKPSRIIVSDPGSPKIIRCNSSEDELLVFAWILEEHGFLWEDLIVLGDGQTIRDWSSNGQMKGFGPSRHLLAKLHNENSLILSVACGRNGTSFRGKTKVHLFDWTRGHVEAEMVNGDFKKMSEKFGPDDWRKKFFMKKK